MAWAAASASASRRPGSWASRSWRCSSSRRRASASSSACCSLASAWSRAISASSRSRSVARESRCRRRCLRLAGVRPEGWSGQAAAGSSGCSSGCASTSAASAGASTGAAASLRSAADGWQRIRRVRGRGARVALVPVPSGPGGQGTGTAAWHSGLSRVPKLRRLINVRAAAKPVPALVLPRDDEEDLTMALEPAMPCGTSNVWVKGTVPAARKLRPSDTTGDVAATPAGLGLREACNPFSGSSWGCWREQDAT
mmetsp:Transcript_121824/g.356016  ORF Transcript_121824/g.356016 Transcript_121824/m.356016 type:complete len:254 (+) Transcript_121824:915-1676(+)